MAMGCHIAQNMQARNETCYTVVNRIVTEGVFNLSHRPFLSNFSHSYDIDHNGTIPFDELVPFDERVTGGEKRLWSFLQIPRGSLCAFFGFEESPYFILLAQILVANLVLELFKWGMPYVVECVKKIAEAVPFLLPFLDTVWNCINRSISATRGLVNECQDTIWSCINRGISATRGLVNRCLDTIWGCVSQCKGHVIQWIQSWYCQVASDQQPDQEVPSAQRPPSAQEPDQEATSPDQVPIFTLLPSPSAQRTLSAQEPDQEMATDQHITNGEANKLKGEHYYFFIQATMAMVSAVATAVSVLQQHNMSLWEKYNLWLYAVFNSGATLFIFQQVASAAVDGAAVCRVERSGSNVDEVIWLFKKFLRIPLFLIVCACIVLIIFTFVLLPWLSKFIFVVYNTSIVCVVYVFHAAFLDFFRRMLNSARGNPQQLRTTVRRTLAKSLLVVLLVPIIWVVGVIVRMNAGELETGFLDPVINDFMARTWYTVVRCQATKVQRKQTEFLRVLDLVQRWT